MKKLVFLFLFFFNISLVYAANNKFKVTLDSCIDGDTARFNIKGEVKTVRFLSIDAPEIAHDDVPADFYGDEASTFTCKALTNASIIKLQYDPKSDQVDKYDRVLAWVFVDDELLQEKLVRGGYARVRYVYDNYLYSDDLKKIQKDAKQKKVGIWKDISVSKDNDDIGSKIFITIVGILVLIILSLLKSIFRKKAF